VWHEAGHAFTSPIVRARATRIAELHRLFDSTNSALVRQHISTWQYAFEENVVRAVVATLIGARRGREAMQAEVREQAENGFVWVPRIAALMQQENVPNRTRYPSLESFADRILDMLTARASVADAPLAQGNP
jgi:hypothetical protein